MSELTECSSLLEEKIHNIIGLFVDTEISNRISMDVELINLGIDSLTFINIIIEIEDELEIEFEDEKLIASEFDTFKDLVEYVRELSMKN